MAVKSLAVKYRPTTFDDVVGQEAIKTILQQQLDTGTIKNVYLFCGGAGTGKTTCARIFANELNNHRGNPIETDAASNNSVDDMRNIIQQAKTKSLESEYKCTTDPQKIPKTILSRAQRYDFQRISQTGIVDRLHYILDLEFENKSFQWHRNSLEYIAKIADGGMRDAITLLDKCLSYSEDLSIDNVIAALGMTDYTPMIELTQHLIDKNRRGILKIVDSVYYGGADLKQFIKQYQNFLLDVCKFAALRSFDEIQLPEIENLRKHVLEWANTNSETCLDLLDMVVRLNSEIKWDSNPKATIQASMLLDCARREEQ